MTQILERVREAIDHYRLLSAGETVVAGVSGGPDSLCLLHVLARLRADYDIGLYVAHLHHRLRGEEADADAAFVAALAADWGLPVTVGQADVPGLAREHGLAVEEAARRARYAFLAEVAAAIGARSIAVGHNADDQAETILMHILRGSGLAGLRGMLPATPLDDYRLLEANDQWPMTNDQWPITNLQPLILIRPLLDITRAEILEYCGYYGLEPRFDRSNLDVTYFRNWLRHEALPLLERHNPNVAEVLRRSARVISDDYELLRSLLLEAWPRIVAEETPEEIAFRLEPWRALPIGLQRSTLREAIHRLRRSLRNINFIHVENALEVGREGTTGHRATLPRGLMLTVAYDRLTIAGERSPEALPDWPLLPAGSEPLPVVVPGETALPGSDWALSARVLTPADLPEGWEVNPDPWQAFLDAAAAGPALALRTRRPGDRFRPLGMGGHTVKLANFLTNEKVPRSVRDRLPLVVCDWGIAWVCGGRPDERAAVQPGSDRILWLRFSN